MKKLFHDDDMEPDCVIDIYREYKNIELEKETRSGSAIYKAITNLIILNGARDWESFDLPEYEELDDHHIVPKSWGKKMNIGDQINSILNKTLIKPDTNRLLINDRLPNEYLKEMFRNNDEPDVYDMLRSHLISKKAVDILMREPFTVEDFQAFIEERKNTILHEIKTKLLDDERQLPDDLKRLNDEIEKVELAMRKFIMDRLVIIDISDFKKKIPGHLIQKIEFRIDKEKKKNPHLVNERENDVDYYFSFLDLQELRQIMTQKNLWNRFEIVFVSKEKLTSEFNDLASLRNAIRHSRYVDKITAMKGEAALLWFKQQLNIG